MVGMFVVAFFMLVIGILGIPLFAHILKLKMKHIIPVVILFSLIGAYSVNNSVNDVLVAISLGVLGVFLARLEIPNTPIVLGLILGDIIESNFIRSSIIVNAQQTNFFTYILTRPLCIGILLLTTYLIWANIRVLNRGKRIQKAANIQQDIQEE
jgi:putative tricarboxylic transport membrane protein